MPPHRFSYCNQLNGLGCSDAQNGGRSGEQQEEKKKKRRKKKKKRVQIIEWMIQV